MQFIIILTSIYVICSYAPNLAFKWINKLESEVGFSKNGQNLGVVFFFFALSLLKKKKKSNIQNELNPLLMIHSGLQQFWTILSFVVVNSFFFEDKKKPASNVHAYSDDGDYR